MTERVAHEFKKNFIEFLDELIEQFPMETDLVIARVFIKDRLTDVMLINQFIKHVFPYREQVEKRDDIFFLNNAGSVFGDGALNHVNHFKKIWNSSQLDNDDRDTIWDWFQLFFSLADKYENMS